MPSDRRSGMPRSVPIVFLGNRVATFGIAQSYLGFRHTGANFHLPQIRAQDVWETYGKVLWKRQMVDS